MRRFLPSIGIVAVGILLSAIVFATLRSLESKNAEASFNGVAQQRLDALEMQVNLTVSNVVSAGALFDASQPVQRKEFDRFAAPLLAGNQAIQALEWIPRVPQRSRQKYERDARNDGFSSFELTERLSPTQMCRAGERAEYFPVFFVVPFKGNEKALGFDLASEPFRREALQSSADSGRLVATNRVKLVQEKSDQYGFLVFRPVYREGVVPGSVQARRLALSGFALAVFRVADIVEKAGATPSSASGLNLAIFDRDGKPGERLLYPRGAHLDGVADLPQGFRATRTIVVGERTWELAAYPLPGGFVPTPWSSWATLFAGLLLTSLLTAHLADRKRTEAALQQSEERARLLFATIPHATFVFDVATFEFLEVNDTAVQQYGYSRYELLHMKTSNLRFGEGVDRWKARPQQDPCEIGCPGQSKHRNKDGRIIDVEIHYQDLDYDGHKARLAIVQDVTERNRLEVDLRQAQKLEAVGSLAAGIAHEINTPIQFVGDNLRFLSESFADLTRLVDHCYRQERIAAEKALDLDYLMEEVPKALKQSLDGVSRVATLVQAMKVFAHPDRREKAATDINDALHSTLIVARNEMKYVADVETEFGNLPRLVCNIGEVNQVFLNLLINAAYAIGEVKKATGEKGLIRVRTSLEDHAVLISISDTGCGIPENIRGRIFDPFFTTKESGRGTGQGLAIARSVVVDRHGGTLTFTSEVGKGTTFYVRLPLDEPAGPAEEKPSEPQ